VNPEQFQQLLSAVSAASQSSSSGFNWVQGALALGATLVSVTGVVVGMRSAIAALAKQVEDQRSVYTELAKEVHEMARELAVLKYAMGIESKTAGE
jgi:hypothetical protein